MTLPILFVGKTTIQVNFFGRLLVRSRPFVRSFVANFGSSTRKKIRRREQFGKKSLGRPDRFRQQIIEIRTILRIFKPFEILKFHGPLFGEFGRSSQDMGASDYSFARILG